MSSRLPQIPQVPPRGPPSAPVAAGDAAALDLETDFEEHEMSDIEEAEGEPVPIKQGKLPRLLHEPPLGMNHREYPDRNQLTILFSWVPPGQLMP